MSISTGSHGLTTGADGVGSADASTGVDLGLPTVDLTFLDAGLQASALEVEAARVRQPTDHIGPLLQDTTDWGLGEKDLSGVQDTDYGILVFGDPDHGGLAVIQGGADGFSLSAGDSVDGFLLSQILEGAGTTFANQSEMLDIFAHRAQITLTGETTYTAHHTSEILGTAAAEIVIGSSGDDLVREGSGNDNLVAGAGNDIAWGDAGNDAMAGDDGNDQLWGGAGTDSLDGGNGADILMGGSGADTLSGGADNDVLMGGTDNDSIVGGDGADTIVGGIGSDTMTGGAGADVFLFVAGDAGTTATTQDSITDFEVGTDKIDLTGLSHAAVFEKTNATKDVDPHVAYEVLLVNSPHGTTIEIDSNGDGKVDMDIVVATSDHSHLSVSDFVV